MPVQTGLGECIFQFTARHPFALGGILMLTSSLTFTQKFELWPLTSVKLQINADPRYSWKYQFAHHIGKQKKKHLRTRTVYLSRWTLVHVKCYGFYLNTYQFPICSLLSHVLHAELWIGMATGYSHHSTFAVNGIIYTFSKVEVLGWLINRQTEGLAEQWCHRCESLLIVHERSDMRQSLNCFFFSDQGNTTTKYWTV